MSSMSWEENLKRALVLSIFPISIRFTVSSSLLIHALCCTAALCLMSKCGARCFHDKVCGESSAAIPTLDQVQT